MTTPELLTRLIAATEDMIERLESCIADGNGELEDDRPAIAEAQEAVAAAKATLYSAEGETPQPVNLRPVFDKIAETDRGNYVGELAEDNWLAGVDFSPLVVARLMEVAYLMGRHDAETEHYSAQGQRTGDAVADLYRRIKLYAKSEGKE